ncbi:adenosylcobinamide-phosphate synthase [Prauserella sediminis]|uniref:Cobalamin biosynthesis protein CobD n=1 Tax=Prauserella sediminis TaxID=577680 RepID=A0A839XM11_9PSEU|nr:cobalamin biosynthesis protein [Prauserella sediminis]MBB3661798.1 adenosylcobinamide-phosphate synthase [Prauserella sediminis]
MSAHRAVGLLLGVVADGLIGEPRRAGPPRPVAALPQAADTLARRIGAAGATTVVTTGAVAVGMLVERAVGRHRLLRTLAVAAGTWSVLGGARIAADGTELARDLENGDFDTARARISTVDLRCTEDLDLPGLSRASIEVVADQTSNAVVSPLVWGAVAGLPGMLAARTVTVLGRRPGMELDIASARSADPVARRLDEIANLVPARLTATLTTAAAPVVGGSARSAWQAWRRDTAAHPSPNAGRAEAAFAGALEIRLGGRTVYPRGVAELPVLGAGRNPDAGHVTRAVELSRVVGLCTAGVSAVLAAVSGLGRRRR